MHSIPFIAPQFPKTHPASFREKIHLFTIKEPNVFFRTLTANDFKAYIKIRTKALIGEDARYFTANPQKEFDRSTEDWRKVCTETPDNVIIGAFKERELIGTWSVMRSESDKTGKTAYYGAVYVLPEFRHTTITKNLIQLWKAWAILHGCDKAIFTIRNDNPWLEEHVKRGAVIKKKYEAAFADGSVALLFLVEHSLYAPYNQQEAKLESELLWLLALEDNGIGKTNIDFYYLDVPHMRNNEASKFLERQRTRLY